MTHEVATEKTEQITLWKRAWRRPNGDVHTTRPYASQEELMQNETEDSPRYGNIWHGEPYSYVPDKYGIADFRKFEEKDRIRAKA